MSAADHVNGSLQEIAGRSASTIGLAPIKPLTRDEFTTLVNLSRRAIRADTDTRRALHQQRVNIIPATFYSEVPRVEDIESSFEFRVPDGPYNAPEVFNPGVMAEFLAAIDHYADEFDPPTQGDRDAPNGYFWDNPAFSYSDAMAYYCVLRHLRPAQVMEIGSGFSSLIALQALERNGTGQLCCVEPNPMPWLVGLGDRIELIRVPVQSIDPLIFNARLHDGDVLFIDSTHTVKAGSDCLHIYLRVVPALNRQSDNPCARYLPAIPVAARPFRPARVLDRTVPAVRLSAPQSERPSRVWKRLQPASPSRGARTADARAPPKRRRQPLVAPHPPVNSLISA